MLPAAFRVAGGLSPLAVRGFWAAEHLVQRPWLGRFPSVYQGHGANRKMGEDLNFGVGHVLRSWNLILRSRGSP